MSEWKKVKLGEVCDFINGGAWSDKEYAPEGIPVLKVTNCKNSGFSLSELSYLPYSLEQKYIQNKLQRNDVIIATVGSHPNLVNSSAGRSVIVNSFVEGFYLNQNAVCIRTKDEEILDQLFWGYYSKYYLFQNYIQMRGKGAANQMRIAISAIKNYPMPLPPINVQRHIASILSRYDSLIENYQKQIKLLEEAAQRLYKEWFIDLHFPEHENTKIVDGVPEGWEKKTIADVCTNISSGSTPSRSNKAYWENGTIKWVKTKELQDGWILDTEEYISQEGYNSSSTKMFPVNTILMAIYASPTLGRLGILSTDCCCNQAALGLIADENIISWQWLFWKLYELRDEFNAIARGAGQQNISGIVVKNKEIIIPDKGVIDGFTSVVSKMFEQQKSLSSQLRLLTEARDRLLPKLMSGEITV